MAYYEIITKDKTNHFTNEFYLKFVKEFNSLINHGYVTDKVEADNRGIRIHMRYTIEKEMHDALDKYKEGKA